MLSSIANKNYNIYVYNYINIYFFLSLEQKIIKKQLLEPSQTRDRNSPTIQTLTECISRSARRISNLIGEKNRP